VAASVEEDNVETDKLVSCSKQINKHVNGCTTPSIINVTRPVQDLLILETV
jgi:hypothetical protein